MTTPGNVYNTTLYFDYHWPLQIVDLIQRLIQGSPSSPNNPQLPVDAANREWYSQPRDCQDPTVEVIEVRFRLPLSVSELSWEALRVPCKFEVWYQDRSNNWRQVLDKSRIPVVLDMQGAGRLSWYKYTTSVYQIVAKALQFRVVRKFDRSIVGQQYVIGMKNTLIKRNVYERAQGTAQFEDEQDAMGNVITKYIKDWDASKSIDSDFNTFWKSAPQPDPSAVVSNYYNISDDEGTPKLIDRVWIDPVYTGQMLNIYYSSDDTVGATRLSPISLYPTEDENTEWRTQRGRSDVAPGTDDSYYRWTMNIGPLISRDAWIGVEWIPFFATDDPDAPPDNPVLYRTIADPSTGQSSPTVYYDVGAAEFVLLFDDGDTDQREYRAPVSTLFIADNPLRIVAGWKYGDTDKVHISVKTKTGVVVAEYDAEPSTLPALVSFDGTNEFANFKGTLTATIVKLSNYEGAGDSFQANPVMYVNPDPILPNEDGSIPSTSLDAAVYAADWTQQEHGTGGADQSHYEDKEWTPIWRDYTVERGMLFFPQQISCKYLKFEFTNLTEEAYPVYESGVEVAYKVFPISVMQQSSQGPRLYTGAGGFLGLGSFISLNGVRSVNWLNPFSIGQAVNSVFGKTYDPVTITTGPGYVTDSLPNTLDSDVTNTYRVEIGSDYVYRRDALDPYILAQNSVETIIKAEGLAKIAPYTDIPWQEIEASNAGAISHVKQTGALPVQGTDWWFFPGQTLKISASVMERLTSTSTVVERKLTLERRVRFNTTSVHRYERKVVKRDAAVAYFAGVREIIPFSSTYIVDQDKDQYDFTIYDNTQWVFNNIKQNSVGSISQDLTSANATIYKSFQTQSTFAKARVDFRDSGLVRSNGMWADMDIEAGSDDTNIPDDQLAYYTKTIPETIPGGNWSDSISEWASATTVWGSPYGVVSINVDGSIRYQGKRALHIRRAPLAGEAGIKVKQWTNYVPGALFRIGAVFLKPFDNGNQITLRLRRMSDGVFLYEETIDAPVGRWFEYQTKFTEIPGTDPLEGGPDGYEVQLTMSGDEEDELYLSNLYTEVAHIRYFVRLGSSGAFLHEVTDLRYADTTYVTTTTPVREMSVQAAILSPKAWCFGCTVTPTYLK